MNSGRLVLFTMQVQISAWIFGIVSPSSCPTGDHRLITTALGSGSAGEHCRRQVSQIVNVSIITVDGDVAHPIEIGRSVGEVRQMEQDLVMLTAISAALQSTESESTSRDRYVPHLPEHQDAHPAWRASLHAPLHTCGSLQPLIEKGIARSCARTSSSQRRSRSTDAHSSSGCM